MISLHLIFLSVDYKVGELAELLCPLKSRAPYKKRARALAAITRAQRNYLFF